MTPQPWPRPSGARPWSQPQPQPWQRPRPRPEVTHGLGHDLRVCLVHDLGYGTPPSPPPAAVTVHLPTAVASSLPHVPLLHRHLLPIKRTFFGGGKPSIYRYPGHFLKTPHRTHNCDTELNNHDDRTVRVGGGGGPPQTRRHSCSLYKHLSTDTYQTPTKPCSIFHLPFPCLFRPYFYIIILDSQLLLPRGSE